MQYSYSEEWTKKARGIAIALGLDFIDLEKIACVKSKGSGTKRVIARIHGLGKVLQLGMNTKPFYVIELLSERFDRQSEEEKTKTIIHELLHVPHSFGGGFRHHKPHVNFKTVEEAYRKLVDLNEKAVQV
jgi:predicted metallopeptidase